MLLINGKEADSLIGFSAFGAFVTFMVIAKSPSLDLGSAKGLANVGEAIVIGQALATLVPPEYERKLMRKITCRQSWGLTVFVLLLSP